MSTRPAVTLLALALFAATGIAGCIEVPALDDAGDPQAENADYPDLIPLGPVVARSTDPVEASAELKADLTGRTAQLQRRADALRQNDVLDEESRQRLLQGLGQ